MGGPFPLKITTCHRGIWTPSNTWFAGLIQVLSLHGISISSAVFAGLTSVTDRQADRPRYSKVTIGRIYVCSMGDVV